MAEHRFTQLHSNFCDVCGLAAELLTDMGAMDECAGVNCCSGDLVFAEWLTRRLVMYQAHQAAALAKLPNFSGYGPVTVDQASVVGGLNPYTQITTDPAPAEAKAEPEQVKGWDIVADWGDMTRTPGVW